MINHLREKKTLEANVRYCIRSPGFFMIGSKEAKISRINDDETLGKTETNAFGATSSDTSDGCLIDETYQIVVSTTQTVHLYTFYRASYTSHISQDGFTGDIDSKVYVTLNKNFEGKLSTSMKGTATSQTLKETQLFFFNPYGATISAKNGDNALTSIDNDNINGDVTNKNQGFISVDAANLDSLDTTNIDETVSSTIKITGNDGSIVLPEKFFEVKKNTIYTISTPQSSLNEDSTTSDDDNGLSGGAIAGIVITCIVVVGSAAGFCVYWFMFRNKTDAPEP